MKIILGVALAYLKAFKQWIRWS